MLTVEVWSKRPSEKLYVYKSAEQDVFTVRSFLWSRYIGSNLDLSQAILYESFKNGD